MTWIKNEDRLQEQKVCTHCGRTKSLAFYYYNSNHKKHQSYCKQCAKQRSMAYSKTRRKVHMSNEWLRKRYSNLQRAATYRKGDFTLTFEEFRAIRSKPCFYCDQTFRIMTLDKVDPLGGYVVSNCVSACHNCNRLKGGITPGMCRKVLTFLE